MSTIYKCDRCGREMNKIHRKIRDILMAVDYDLCDECFKDFKSFMFGPERDLDSKTTLRPWSEVGAPPKINGCKLKSCEQCEFDSISIDDESCASGGSENEDCEQCKFKDFSWDEEPCSSCDFSILTNNCVKRNNFEPKEEE